MDWLIAAVGCLVVVLFVLGLAIFLLWLERKGSALLQNRFGANRANFFGIFPYNLGLLNTAVADPVKMFTKEDFVPRDADRLIHSLAPFLALFPALITFMAIPFGDAIEVAGRTIPLQVINLDVGVLYISALLGLGVYGIVLAGWASNNRWALLGSIRGTAQMISYELAMGLALVSMILLYGTLDLQEMAHQQGGLLWGVLPAWGVFYQPLAFVIIFVAGIAESKRVPFDIPEAESELIAGYFTEYSGGKQAAFMLADFAEVVMVAGLTTALFFGGWQVPYLTAAGFEVPGLALVAVPGWAITVLQVAAFVFKVVFFCWLQFLIRWTVPRMRYDQLMNLGWKGMMPVALVNVCITAAAVLFLGETA